MPTPVTGPDDRKVWEAANEALTTVDHRREAERWNTCAEAIYEQGHDLDQGRLAAAIAANHARLATLDQSAAAMEQARQVTDRAEQNQRDMVALMASDPTRT